MEKGSDFSIKFKKLSPAAFLLSSAPLQLPVPLPPQSTLPQKVTLNQQTNRTLPTSLPYACPHCEETFETISTLNNHMTEIHPEGFDSVIGLSQILLQIEESMEDAVKESNISRLIKCQLCEKLL